MLKGLTDAKIKRYEAALSLQMYLVHELGPTKFVFKVGDSEDAPKVRISLKSELECSCGAGTTGASRCSHALFALVKVFKVPNTSELLWQDKYSEQQINSILEGRFKKQKGVLEQAPKREYLKRKKDTDGDGKSKPEPKKLKTVDHEDSCPICYDSLGTQASLTPCKCCQNYFHSKCLLTWSRHHLSNNPSAPIKCPMCRAEWGPSPYMTVREIETDVENFSKREMLHPNSTCFGCNKKSLVGPIFQNLWHPSDTVVCQSCFELKFMNKTYEILSKMKAKDQWTPFNCPATIPFPVFLVFALKSKQDISGFSHNTKELLLQVVGKDVSNTVCMACKQVYDPSGGASKGHSVLKLPCEHRVCSICLIKTWSNAIKIAKEGYESLVQELQKSELASSGNAVTPKIPNPPLPRCTCPLDNTDVFPALIPSPSYAKKVASAMNSLLPSSAPKQQLSNPPANKPSPLQLTSKRLLPPMHPSPQTSLAPTSSALPRLAPIHLPNAPKPPVTLKASRAIRARSTTILPRPSNTAGLSLHVTPLEAYRPKLL